MKTLKYRQLEAKGACSEQVGLFREKFPNGAPMTVEAALSVAQEFDWDWAAKKLLSQSARVTYEEARRSACAIYYEARGAAWAAYEEASQPSEAAYEEALRSAEVAYEEAAGAAWAAYEEASWPARAARSEALWSAEVAYKEACARAFAFLFIQENEA